MRPLFTKDLSWLSILSSVLQLSGSCRTALPLDSALAVLTIHSYRESSLELDFLLMYQYSKLTAVFLSLSTKRLSRKLIEFNLSDPAYVQRSTMQSDWVLLRGFTTGRKHELWRRQIYLMST
jgi:hypothetical protein